MIRVYVINSSYECIGNCKLHRAVGLVNTCRHCGESIDSFKKCTNIDGRHAPKAEVVKYTDREVRSGKTKIRVPHVIRVFKHIPLYSRRLKYSNKMVWERDNFQCKYCGMHITSKAQLTTDHIKARSKGGKTVYENMVTACSGCNKRKANRSLEDSGMKLSGPNPPRAPMISSHMKKINEEVQAILKAEWNKELA